MGRFIQPVRVQREPQEGVLNILEMGELVESIGGYMVLRDLFGQSVFKESLRRVFQTYKEDVPEDAVSNLEVGRGGANAWSLVGINLGTTIVVYFDISNPGTSPLPEGNNRFIQFLVKYQHSNG